MWKTLTGYCRTQKRNYSISADVHETSDLASGVTKYEAGRINCCYANNGVKCRSCSIAEAFNKRF